MFLLSFVFVLTRCLALPAAHENLNIDSSPRGFGWALKCDGINDWASIPASLSSNFTFELWAQVHRPGTSTLAQMTIGQQTIFRIVTFLSGDVTIWQLVGASTLFIDGPPAVDVPTHLAVVVTTVPPATQETQMKANDAPLHALQTNASSPPTTGIFVSKADSAWESLQIFQFVVNGKTVGSGSVRLGAMRGQATLTLCHQLVIALTSTTFANPAAVTVDDVRLWSVPRRDSEIAATAFSRPDLPFGAASPPSSSPTVSPFLTSFVPPAGLVSWWPLELPSGVHPSSPVADVIDDVVHPDTSGMLAGGARFTDHKPTWVPTPFPCVSSSQAPAIAVRAVVAVTALVSAPLGAALRPAGGGSVPSGWTVHPVEKDGAAPLGSPTNVEEGVPSPLPPPPPPPPPPVAGAGAGGGGVVAPPLGVPEG
eukprot:TRINITY_DN4618_c1_g1_i2.p1 TRINITY_DN4618_c1_g1~~TRINITY_DN4618_c1_g1_i2.p1  ORF type:complete len:424 (-),score=66.57 TRINITY_DN4618_c1_g1_i2:59-1330(-)